VLALPPAITPVFDRVGGPRRAAILFVGLVTAALIFGVAQWATRPTWVAVFTNVPMESVGTMTDKLTEAGIAYELGSGGAEIRVKSEDAARTRVTLAREGAMPNAGRPGWEIFDGQSWGMTDFSQRINYRRALEGELERTIGKMRGVDAAKVHIAMQEGSAFRRSDKPLEASVVLKLKSGDTPPADVVQGIAHLVASSVDGLDSDKVTVVDDAGRMLTLDAELGSLAGLTSRQLSVQRDVEHSLEQKAAGIVSQIVGAANARVQVSAQVNFDRVERTTQAVDPDKQAVATEQRAEITPGAQGGAASSNVATSYETTKSTESYSGAIGNVKRLTVAVLVNDRVLPGARPTAVPRTRAELARIDTLVRDAIGLDTARGDRLSVVNVTFDGALAAPTAEAKPDVWARAAQFERPIVSGVALLAVVVVALVTVRALRPARTPALAALDGVPALAAGDASAGEPALPGATAAALAALDGEPQQILVAAPAASAEPVILREVANPVRDHVVAIIDQRPEATTRVVRAWLKQD
jgi:flagellar M-ring protein FliF